MAARRTPSLLALRAFEAAARRLSFTAAARELHVSQAAVSRHVRGLEADVGRQLFTRLHRRVVLTAAGERFAAELSAAFVRIGRAVEAVRGNATRRLRLSVEPAFAARWLVPRLGRFAAAHPHIELQLETSDEFRVLGREADIAIRYIGAHARRDLHRGRLIFALEGVPVIAAAQRPRRWREDSAVLGQRLLHDDDGRAWRDWFSAAGLEGFERARHQYFSDYSLALAAALQGEGVVLGTRQFIGAELRSARLRPLGRTRVAFGAYRLLEAAERGSARLRSAFNSWLAAELAGSA
jgi:LysR family transcriptional regulator, glycine cleavage system transcriptional activator